MPPHSRSGGSIAASCAAPGPIVAQPGATERALVPSVGPRILLAPLLALLLVLASGLGLGWWLADRLVREDARFLAATTADVLQRLVPGLDTIVETGRLEAEQAEGLRAAVGRSRVVALALLDRSGRPIPAARGMRPTAGPPLSDEGTRAALLAEAEARRAIAVGLHRVAAAGWPEVVGEAVVPVARDGRLVGFLELALDLSPEVARYRPILTRSIVVGGALCVLAALLPGFFLWRRLKALEAAAAEVRHLAFHDALTGLPNRLLFQDRLAQAIARVHREGGRGALLMLDLDDFKSVNDALGHAGGDALLRAVARRLGHAVRATDTVARLGGDEFALVIAPLADLSGLEAVLDRLRRELARPVRIDGRPVGIAATIGIALFPDDGEEPDPLVRRADGALYRGKAKGRGAVVWHREPARQPSVPPAASAR